MPDFGRWTSNGGDPSLNEINRTDRFLDALAFEQPVYATDRGEAELINLLSGWRDDIRDAPLTVPVTPRDAVIALDSAQRTRTRSRRTLALVGSTAAAVLCLGGFASVVAGAGPGDSLYGLRTMIFGEQPAPRDDAVMLASQQLAEVQQLVDQGQWQAAQDKLETLTTTVATVNDDVRKQELVTEWQELTVKVEAQDAAAVLPPDAPPPVFPDVVVLQTPTSPDNTGTESPPSATTSPSETTPPSSPTSSETTPPSSPTSSETTPPSSPTSSPTSTSSETTPPTSGPVSQLPATEPSTAPPSTPPPSQTSEEEPLPTSSVASTPPLTTTTVAMTTKTQPAPSSTVSEAAEEAPTATVEAPPVTVPAPPATVQAPPTQRQAPVTTTFVVPEPDTGSGGEGS
ncbi:anti-sigma-D factor RsdA [Mycobacterium neglectum]|uniref:anti-sigma-D factor RsdA n=1 Tax=Mycobacterium neglectum TaxID=242737 RepID=UPI000BFEE51B|nr:anti-sigma-D factor RsdA [Mycobacterium neglectum]